jgi:hypothetical protein
MTYTFTIIYQAFGLSLHSLSERVFLWQVNALFHFPRKYRATSNLRSRLEHVKMHKRSPEFWSKEIRLR